MDSVHNFMNRLNQPVGRQSSLQLQSAPSKQHSQSSLQLQSAASKQHSQSSLQLQSAQSMQHSQSSAHLQLWSQSKLQSQLSQLQPQAKPSQQRRQPFDATAVGRSDSGSGAAHSVSSTAARQPSVQPASGRSSVSGDGLYMGQGEEAASPVQSAVAAVAGRLLSVQQGLASAEGRLAQLTGRTTPNR